MVTPLKVGCQVDEEHKKLTENTPYQVIPPNKFPDYRAAFDGPLSWTRPKKLEFDQLKDLARVGRELLKCLQDRSCRGTRSPLVNGFKVTPEDRRLKQVVFKLSLTEQERLVWNRSISFWQKISDGNSKDMLALGRALNVIINPEEFEQHIFPVYAGEDQKELFKQKVESTQHWKRAFMTLHQMLQFLKNYIFLQMFSPCFDFRFCELRYDFEPTNSWNPLPVDLQSQSSLYQTKHQFQKLSDFLLVTDQIQALVNVLTYETSRWRNVITSAHSILHEMSPEINPKWIGGGGNAKVRLLGFDHQNLPSGQSFSIVRILALTNSKAVILTLALDGKTKAIKKLICRTDIRKHNLPFYVSNNVMTEDRHSHIVIVDKYVALFEQTTLQCTDQDGNPAYVPGPSLTIWDRNGKFKEKVNLKFNPEQSGLTISLKRLPGKRFALIQKHSLGEASSVIITLGATKEPLILTGEVEDSSSSYFCLRVADHVQFYTYTDHIKRDPTYLFSIRSFNDEKIKLCSGGQQRFATSRISLTYHIQVFDFPEMKVEKLNSRNGSNKSVPIVGQTETLADGLEPLTYLKPHMKLTRPFKQSQKHNYESSADIRLRVLAMASGAWQINENDTGVPRPGENFGLCPGGVLIHDIQHNLLLFQPITPECSQEGRHLLSLSHLTGEHGSSEYCLPLGRAWGRLSGADMHFYSQSASTGALTQHKFSFSGAMAMDPKCAQATRRRTRVRFETKEIADELSYLSLD